MSNRKKIKNFRNTLGQVETPADMLNAIPDRIIIGEDKKSIREQMRHLGIPKGAGEYKEIRAGDLAATIGEGTCVICLTPTDSGLFMWGEAEWHIAGLVAAGLTENHASNTFSSVHHADLGNVPDGILLEAYRICARCAKRAHMTPGLIVSRTLPVYSNPELFSPDACLVEDGTPLGDGVMLMENNHGTYLLTPVVVDADSGRGANWEPGAARLRVISQMHDEQYPVHVIQIPNSELVNYRQHVLSVSRETRVPIWPFRRIGITEYEPEE